MHRILTVPTARPGLYEITSDVAAVVAEASHGNPGLEALCTVFIRHTSASLVIQENADPSARHDLERWLARLVPEGDPSFTHDAEGPDDMPAHVKSMLTQVSLGIPVVDGRLALGRWQGIWLFEHRRAPHRREITVLVR